MKTPKNVLVIGGTRFFGRRLVQNLLAGGCKVTIANRGVTKDDFGGTVKRIHIDRDQHKETFKTLSEVAQASKWDVVFDNTCYSPNQAKTTMDAIQGHAGRLVLTSTQSVYKYPGARFESDYDSAKETLQMGDRADFNYQICKRQAEKIYAEGFKNTVAVRIPIVFGPDDYTGRLNFHIKKILCGAPLFIPNLNARTKFIHAADAAQFLEWISIQSFVGPVNACSDQDISAHEIVKWIEVETGKKANLLSLELMGPYKDINEVPDDIQSPIIGPSDTLLDNSRARELGYTFMDARVWIPALIKDQVIVERRNL